jgi:uncharacterized protein (TIGR02597 family)
MKNQIAIVALAAAIPLIGQAQVTPVYTAPVGFVSVAVPANSDAILAVPMNRASEFQGIISSISGNTITVAGTPGWALGQFVPLFTANKTYALQIASGAKEGMTLKVTNNGTNTLTVEVPAGEDLTGIVTGANGDQVDLMPYWTPASLFQSAPPAGVEIQGFSGAGVGINLGASEIYAHAGGNAWEDGVNGGESSHVTLPFGSGFIFRNNNPSSYTVSVVGAVPMSKSRIRLSTLASDTAQDVAFGYLSPVPEALSSIGNPSVALGSQSANALGFPVNPGDEIQGFDNSAPGINKGASEIYIWSGSAWEDGINGGEIDFNVKLKPAFGYIFRKAATAQVQTVVWTKLQSYLQ